MKIRKVIGLEIENPFRYRAYFVGKKPVYNIQNGAYIDPEYDEVCKIDKEVQLSAGTWGWVVHFTNNRQAEIGDDTIGVIEHCEMVEVQDD